MAFFGRRTRGTVPFLPQPMLDFPSRSPNQDDSGRVLRPLAVESLVWIQLRPGATWKKGCIRAQKSDRNCPAAVPTSGTGGFCAPWRMFLGALLAETLLP